MSHSVFSNMLLACALFGALTTATLHAFFIPDVDGAHVVVMTTGVTW
jgi:hypothetical protein